MWRDRVYMLDMLESARLAVEYISGKSQEQFRFSVQLQDAVIRRIEIISEAAGRISEQTRLKYKNIPWSDVIGMRNVMIHGYDDVNIDIVWDTLIVDLPKLIKQLEPLVPPEK